MDLHLKDRVAAVAGASAGLGFASALTLAQEGCRVAICSRGGERLDKAAQSIRDQTGSEVIAIAMDVSQPAGARQFIRQVVDHFKRLDIVVANSGGPPSGQFSQMTDEQWLQGVQGNLLSTVAMFSEALPTVQKSDQGRLIAITSISAKQPLPNLVLSNAARAGVHGVVKTLSREIAATGVTVNAVCPGNIQTDRQIELAQQAAKREGITVEQALAGRASTIPIGRLGDPMEFGAAVTYLCSRQASFISGVALLVDGGQYAALP